MNVNVSAKLSSAVQSLNQELLAGSPDLVGHDDLLRSVLAGSGDCIKVLDLDGNLLFMSEGGKQVMEVDDFAPLRGCHWPGFWTGHGNVQAAAAVAEAKAGGTARFRGPATTAKGTPKFWDVQVSPILNAQGKPTHLLSISRDITEEWRAAERARFLTEELKHRVKNTLSIAMAIAGQTFRGKMHEAARAIFNARMRTLDEANAILTESGAPHSAVRPIVEKALAPFRTDEERFRLSGPDVHLGAKQAVSLALAVNELATNATKYGALSAPAGMVDISWSDGAEDATPGFRFQWRESGGPAVGRSSRQGFGSRILTQVLPQDFDGKAELSFTPPGLSYMLTAPLENLRKNG